MNREKGIVHLIIPLIIIMVVAIGAGLMLTQSGTSFFTGAKNSLEKITICHIPPGNPEQAIRVNISKNAWEQGHDPHNAHSLDFAVTDSNSCPPSGSPLPTTSPSPVPSIEPTVSPTPTDFPEID